MAKISIQFTRFSAFYTPLLATCVGGFLKDEGLEVEHSVSPPGVSAIKALLDGSAQVVQSAVSQGFGPLERGEENKVRHFAQINEMDGFFITGREADPDFSWSKLANGPKVLVDHGAQPMAMFKYACHKEGVNYDDIDAVDAGNVKEMDKAFRDGTGDYIHQQGPAPQQLEHDGFGHVVASVGEAIGPCAFSSLAATPAWLATDEAKAFMRGYKKCRQWIQTAPAEEIADMEADYFPEVDKAVLAKTIAFYQKLGNWAPHVEITREAWEVTVDVFLHAGLISKRHDYDKVIAQPPETN